MEVAQKSLPFRKRISHPKAIVNMADIQAAAELLIEKNEAGFFVTDLYRVLYGASDKPITQASPDEKYKYNNLVKLVAGSRQFVKVGGRYTMRSKKRKINQDRPGWLRRFLRWIW